MSNAENLATLGAAGAYALGFRNKIINGDMRIDQRWAGGAVSAVALDVGNYLVDRFKYGASVAAKFSAQQNQGAVTPPEGFKNYLGLTSASAYSVGASDYFYLRQCVEGFNVEDLAWGSANAKHVTLTFRVRSSLTGTFGGNIGNSDFSRVYPFTYSISSANTWETKTVTIPGDTAGTWLTNNGIGLNVTWGLGYGTSLSGAANAWNAGTHSMPTGAVQVVATNGATFQITGVQLEKGKVATPFEHRPFGFELSQCQRYYAKTFALATAPAQNVSAGALFWSCGVTGTVTADMPTWQLPVEMRGTPVVTTYNPYAANAEIRNVTDNADWSSTTAVASSSRVRVYGNSNAGANPQDACALHLAATAEL